MLFCLQCFLGRLLAFSALSVTPLCTVCHTTWHFLNNTYNTCIAHAFECVCTCVLPTYMYVYCRYVCLARMPPSQCSVCAVCAISSHASVRWFGLPRPGCGMHRQRHYCFKKQQQWCMCAVFVAVHDFCCSTHLLCVIAWALHFLLVCTHLLCW